MNGLGYNKPLYILPFDHRSSFAKLFPRGEIKEYKKIIYKAFEIAVSKEVPREFAAILVDEEYGDEILRDAKEKSYTTLLTIEKSGAREFDFEYGDFPAHIEKYSPTFAKALVRHPVSLESIDKLKKLNDFCREGGYKLILELLAGDKDLIIGLINKFQEEGVEPDVWKLEGMETEKDFQDIILQVKSNGRENVGVVVLGRGEDKAMVEKWIITAAKVEGVIGFAIGRTVFMEPLIKLKNGEIDREEAISGIAENFIYFYNLFNENRRN